MRINELLGKLNASSEEIIFFKWSYSNKLIMDKQEDIAPNHKFNFEIKYTQSKLPPFLNQILDIGFYLMRKKKNKEPDIDEILNHMSFLGDTQARVFSAMLNTLFELNTTPILSELNLDKDSAKIEKHTVLNIVLKKLPVIDESVGLEKILEFKMDKDSKTKQLALRNWVSDISKKKLSQNEIVEHLDYLIYDYENHYKLHKLKYSRSVVEIFITSTLEILENVAKFKLSNVSKTIFDIKRKEIEMLESELKLSSREVAFICKANEKFML